MLNKQISFPELTGCRLCPRMCKTNRYSNKLGFCNSDSKSGVVRICIHKGEEPVIGGKQGVCNIFFGHCNMQCVFCQNYQISNNINKIESHSFESVIEQIIEILKSGVNTIGFVSPTHFIPQMKFLIENIRLTGFNPVIVYNSNAYENVEQIKLLEDYIDIYLPDIKYFNDKLAKKYSFTSNYFIAASKVIKEMYRQKGSSLIVNDDGFAESGLIIRHLVLPNNIDNSIKILRFIAEEISIKVAISIMSQFFPSSNVATIKELNRRISIEEYNQVLKELYNLGFTKGWVQDLDSYNNYLPDFDQENPF